MPVESADMASPYSTDDFDALSLLYRGLVALIERGGGEDFHNGDQGHPVYRLGAKGERGSRAPEGEDRSILFLTLRKLTTALRERGAGEMKETWFREDLATWQGFCKFAVECYTKKPRVR